MSELQISLTTDVAAAIDRLAVIVQKGFDAMAMQLEELVAAVNEAAATVAAEIEQAAEAIEGINGATAEDQAVIDAQVAKLKQITAAVTTIVPDEAQPPA